LLNDSRHLNCQVFEVEDVQIDDWDDEHPYNKNSTQQKFFERAFATEDLDDAYIKGRNKGEFDGLRTASQFVLTLASREFLQHSDDKARELRAIAEDLKKQADRCASQVKKLEEHHDNAKQE
jgi:hypothetical protein